MGKARLLFVFAFAAVSVIANAQIFVGKTSTFTTDLEDWGGADDPGTGPQWTATGGAGDGAGYMRVITDPGARQGSRLAADNDVDWLGDYLAAGVTAISIDLKNFSSVPMNMRVVLFSGLDRWTSTTAYVLQANQDWTRVTFSISQSDLTEVQGTDDYFTSLSNVDKLMIRNADNLSAGGTPVGVHAEVGYDNILAVPEPATLAALGLGALALLRRKRK